MSKTETSDPIDMSLVRIPPWRVEPGRYYLLRLKASAAGTGPISTELVGRTLPVFHKKDSGEIRQLPEQVQEGINVVFGSSNWGEDGLHRTGQS